MTTPHVGLARLAASGSALARNHPMHYFGDNPLWVFIPAGIFLLAYAVYKFRRRQ